MNAPRISEASKKSLAYTGGAEAIFMARQVASAQVEVDLRLT
jgi:hypothetical protein